MKHNNDAKLNPAAWLLFEIFKSACVPANTGFNSSTKTCLQNYKKQFRAVIRVLVWLELADYDRKSALGCSPTDALMTIIAQRPKYQLRSKKTGDRIDRDAIETILEAALKNDASDEELADCAVNALGALGLVRYRVRAERVAPTRRLSDLVAKLRNRERARRYARIELKKLADWPIATWPCQLLRRD